MPTEDEARSNLERVGIRLSGARIRLLIRFAEMVRARNASVNLVSAGDVDRIWSRHVLDSLTGLLATDFAGTRVADVGSGAGFPGIPLAIACPDAEFVLIERTRKRAAFLRHVIRELPLPNTTEEWASAEEIAQRMGSSFDRVTIRAVSEARRAASLAEPLLAERGNVLLWQTDEQRHRENAPEGWSETWVPAPGKAGSMRGIRVMRRMG